MRKVILKKSVACRHLRCARRMASFQQPATPSVGGGRFGAATALGFGILSTSLMYNVMQSTSAAPEVALCASNPDPKNCGKPVDGLPEYTMDEVAQHTNRVGKNASVWVVYKAGVYDITDFIAKHPGGDKRIMLAAGGSIEKFWQLYTQHNDDAVRGILEQYRVGNLKGYVESANTVDTTKMWEAEPKRSPGLIALNQKPFNAETPEAILSDQFLTPNELFFVRNHMPVPDLDSKDFCLLIDGEGLRQNCFTVDQLKELFPQHSVTTTIQCGGNRRSEMAADSKNAKPVKGLSWTAGAIGTAKWTGVRMGDIIKHCQEQPLANDDQHHVHLYGADKDMVGNFGVSIPYQKATAPDEETIVAFEMNGEPIPRDHGYPMRAVVPGAVGVRNCKWLSRVSVQPEEAQTVWQQQDYKKFPPYATAPDPSLPSVQSMPVQSVVMSAVHDTSSDLLKVKGYTYCGGGTPIQRVELSTDGGKSFITAANLLQPSVVEDPSALKPDTTTKKWWAWRHFEAEIEVTDKLQATPDGKFIVCSKAITLDNHEQPVQAAYNFRGLLNNSISCREAVEE